MAGRWGVALMVLALVGCGGPITPTPQPTPLNHATGERDMLLRLSFGGGLPDPGRTIEAPPAFTLYGSGRIIHVVSTSADGSVRSELRQGQLAADAVDSLLRLALNEGGLAVARDRYQDVNVFDGGTTRFEIHAGDIDKVVYVYALGIADESAPSARERAGFRDLVDRIQEATGSGSDLGLFQPTAYRVTLAEPFADEPPDTDWPWPDLVPADFGQDSSGDLMRIMSATQSDAVLGLGITRDLVTRAPDGHLYLVRIHALLPDEVPI